MRFARETGIAVFLVTVTLLGAWNGASNSLGKALHWAGNQEPQAASLRNTYDSVLDRDDCFTHTTDYSLGGVLSVALSFNLGVQFLFLVSDVFNCRLW